MSSYDNWLERPYQEMVEREDEFLEWAEMEGFDLDDPAQLNEANEAYDFYLESLYEDEAEALYERHLDRLEMEAEEREWDDQGW